MHVAYHIEWLPGSGPESSNTGLCLFITWCGLCVGVERAYVHVELCGYLF